MSLKERSEKLVERMDSDTSADARLVMDAAEALDIREYELFRIAYRRWHDAEAVPERLERIFALYMFRQQVPLWVRQYARAALAHAKAGALDPQAFGVPARPAPTPDRRGPMLFWGLLGLTVCFCALLIVSPVDARRDGRFMCTAGPNGSYAEEVARQFTGKRDPFKCGRGAPSRR